MHPFLRLSVSVDCTESVQILKVPHALVLECLAIIIKHYSSYKPSIQKTAVLKLFPLFPSLYFCFFFFSWPDISSPRISKFGAWPLLYNLSLAILVYIDLFFYKFSYTHTRISCGASAPNAQTLSHPWTILI